LNGESCSENLGQDSLPTVISRRDAAQINGTRTQSYQEGVHRSTSPALRRKHCTHLCDRHRFPLPSDVERAKGPTNPRDGNQRRSPAISETPEVARSRVSVSEKAAFSKAGPKSLVRLKLKPRMEQFARKTVVCRHGISPAGPVTVRRHVPAFRTYYRYTVPMSSSRAFSRRVTSGRISRQTLRTLYRFPSSTPINRSPVSERRHGPDGGSSRWAENTNNRRNIN
jgi:hypothetical protein